MNRRLVLKSGLTVLLAGCTVPQPDQPPITIPELTVENLDDESHTVRVRLFDGEGTQIFTDQATLEPAEYENDEWDQPTYATWSDVALTEGRYTLQVTVDSGEPTDHEVPDRGGGCVHPEIEVQPDGSHGIAYFGCS